MGNRLIHRRAADVFDNQVWAWTSNGIVALSEAGTQRMSEPSIGVALQDSQDNIITLGISAPPGGCFQLKRRYRLAPSLAVP